MADKEHKNGITGLAPDNKIDGKISASQDEESLDGILDIPLELSVELGRTKMVINELLKLSQGSIVELTKSSGETLDIYANSRLIAKGEVVAVNDKYGVRLTEIISPSERIKKLK